MVKFKFDKMDQNLPLQITVFILFFVFIWILYKQLSSGFKSTFGQSTKEISDEIKTGLNHIIEVSKTMLGVASDPAKLDKHIDSVTSDINHISILVNSKGQSSSTKEINLDAVKLASSTKKLANAAEKVAKKAVTSNSHPSVIEATMAHAVETAALAKKADVNVKKPVVSQHDNAAIAHQATQHTTVLSKNTKAITTKQPIQDSAKPEPAKQVAVKAAADAHAVAKKATDTVHELVAQKAPAHVIVAASNTATASKAHAQEVSAHSSSNVVNPSKTAALSAKTAQHSKEVDSHKSTSVEHSSSSHVVVTAKLAEEVKIMPAKTAQEATQHSVTVAKAAQVTAQIADQNHKNLVAQKAPAHVVEAAKQHVVVSAQVAKKAVDHANTPVKNVQAHADMTKKLADNISINTKKVKDLGKASPVATNPTVKDAVTKHATATQTHAAKVADTHKAIKAIAPVATTVNEANIHAKAFADHAAKIAQDAAVNAKLSVSLGGSIAAATAAAAHAAQTAADASASAIHSTVVTSPGVHLAKTLSHAATNANNATIVSTNAKTLKDHFIGSDYY